ncbi:SMP-30/gluconolactonase/LRE family protein [Bremerella cremea]|uniref:SMP-30/gluconolactonase/LRE family protein n=1 Tax=Bremerella cremea TaxID=1031537 RepID=A0A368KSG0_9BACT|nr:SMP-30/gluconolactonase/LRE family protein [Bremerella cremea]RCS46126.1 SMP-30/gluconolactonase/LRE family protein [Bremerella cremea]
MRSSLCAAGLLVCLTLIRPVFADDVIKTIGEIERIEPAFDAMVPQDAKIEVLADGFAWSEGPVWVPEKEYLLFSDIPNNRIVKWKPGTGTDVFMQPSGYTGAQKFDGKEPGTNGLAISPEGHLTMCCHGDRNITQIVDGERRVLVSHYDGKRFNSPNDLVYDTAGNLYFTDPPYGLPGGLNGPEAELDFCGVYRLSKDGTLTLLTKECPRPNGIAISPDQKTLYVADSQECHWKAFPLKEDGTVGASKMFYDAGNWRGKRPGGSDGLKVDTAGNLWATGPGGVLVLSPEGNLLGRISTGERTANCAFGPDGTLYMTADRYLCRVKTNAQGLINSKE